MSNTIILNRKLTKIGHCSNMSSGLNLMINLDLNIQFVYLNLKVKVKIGQSKCICSSD